MADRHLSHVKITRAPAAPPSPATLSFGLLSAERRGAEVEQVAA
jgi:hypothetical protein